MQTLFPQRSTSWPKSQLRADWAELEGNIEESLKANVVLIKVFPLMIAATLIVILLQVRSLSTMKMVVMTARLGLAGAVHALLLFNQPFGFTAILGLIGLAGILMRNTLILTEQIKENQAAGLDRDVPF